jgi:hypothetical protein
MTIAWTKRLLVALAVVMLVATLAIDIYYWEFLQDPFGLIMLTIMVVVDVVILLLCVPALGNRTEYDALAQLREEGLVKTMLKSLGVLTLEVAVVAGSFYLATL